jgi:hypothetical protein
LRLDSPALDIHCRRKEAGSICQRSKSGSMRKPIEESDMTDVRRLEDHLAIIHVIQPRESRR